MVFAKITAGKIFSRAAKNSLYVGECIVHDLAGCTPPLFVFESDMLKRLWHTVGSRVLQSILERKREEKIVKRQKRALNGVENLIYVQKLSCCREIFKTISSKSFRKGLSEGKDLSRVDLRIENYR